MTNFTKGRMSPFVLAVSRAALTIALGSFASRLNSTGIAIRLDKIPERRIPYGRISFFTRLAYYVPSLQNFLLPTIQLKSITMSSAQLCCAIYHQTVILVLQFFKSLQRLCKFFPGVVISVSASALNLVFNDVPILVFGAVRLLVFIAKIAKYCYLTIA